MWNEHEVDFQFVHFLWQRSCNCIVV